MEGRGLRPLRGKRSGVSSCVVHRRGGDWTVTSDRASSRLAVGPPAAERTDPAFGSQSSSQGRSQMIGGMPQAHTHYQSAMLPKDAQRSEGQPSATTPEFNGYRGAYPRRRQGTQVTGPYAKRQAPMRSDLVTSLPSEAMAN